MKQKPLFIAFSTQKGGVGKSTFTVLVASYLHYLKGLNVAVMDCDYPAYLSSHPKALSQLHIFFLFKFVNTPLMAENE